MADSVPLAEHEHGGEAEHLHAYAEEQRGATSAQRAAWYEELKHAGVWARRWAAIKAQYGVDSL